MSNEKNEKKNKKIKVVSGNGKIDISPVYKHLQVEKPKIQEKKKNIIIPEENTNSQKFLLKKTI